MNSAVKAAITEPRTMVPPKRCVGGKDEKKKIPKPAQITSIEVMIGCHIWRDTCAQRAEFVERCLERWKMLTMWIMESMPMPIATLVAGAAMVSKGILK